jgi:aspartate racemase
MNPAYRWIWFVLVVLTFCEAPRAAARDISTGRMPWLDTKSSEPTFSQEEVKHSERIGILGGMGPAATADIYRKIIAATPAQKDQEHIPVIIWADPRIPDRTEALQGRGPSPVAGMVEGLTQLKKSGASFAIIACNTAHAFLPEVQKQIDLPIIHMMDETAAAISAREPKVRKVGLLATSGTIQARVYQEALKRRGLECIVPEPQSQEKIMWVIRQVKAGNTSPEVTSTLREAADALKSSGAQVAVLGCTELPLVLQDGQASLPLVDATEALAKAAVKRARKQ